MIVKKFLVMTNFSEHQLLTVSKHQFFAKKNFFEHKMNGNGILQNSTHMHTGTGIIVYRSSLKLRILRLIDVSYIVYFGSVSRFYISKQVGLLLLVEMCEQDGRSVRHSFQWGNLKLSYVTRLVTRLV